MNHFNIKAKALSGRTWLGIFKILFVRYPKENTFFPALNIICKIKGTEVLPIQHTNQG